MTPATRKALQWLVDTIPPKFDVDEDQLVVDETLMQRVWIFSPDEPTLTHAEAYAAFCYFKESGIFSELHEAAPVRPFKPMTQGDRWLVDTELLRKVTKDHPV